MIIANNNDLILMGTTIYMNGDLGVSQSSNNDTLIAIIDKNLNTKCDLILPFYKNKLHANFYYVPLISKLK